jgi:hypothetical protein
MKTKHLILIMGALVCLCFGAEVFAVGSSAGIGGVAAKVKGNLANIAKLITALAYVGGMAFAIGAIAKFKAHKDNPTQIPIGTPIALLFIGAALIFIPSVFSSAGGTLFGGSGTVAGVSGITSFT